MRIFGFEIHWSKSEDKPTITKEALNLVDTIKQEPEPIQEASVTLEVEHLVPYNENFADKKPTAKSKADYASIELPMKSGRSSIPDGVSLLSMMVNEVSAVKPEYPIEFIKALEHLGMNNADVSYAVDNIVQLGFAKYEICFEDSVSDKLKKEMMAFLKYRSKSWYGFDEGLGSLIRDLLAQVAITGAVSGEMVPNDNIDGVKKVVLVTPKNVRFVYDFKEDIYKPFQVVNGLISTVVTAGLHPLNQVTYKYAAIRRFNENPYAIPPFLAALENIVIEKDMMKNFRLVIKKLGLLGFLSVMVKAPAQAAGEENIAYQSRMKSYLEELGRSSDQALSKGYILGFKDQQEVKMENTTTNVEGANILMNMNDQHKMAGLKQDPIMLGRNFSTTETLGRVILTKMTSQIVTYQEIVATFLSHVFLMDLQLAGYPIKFLDVEFEPPILSDKVKLAQARAAELGNLVTLFNQGIINNTTFAQEAGYEEPDQEEPRAPVQAAIPKGGTNPSSTGTDVTGNSRDNTYALAMLDLNPLQAPEFDYLAGCDHSHEHVSFRRQFYDVYKMSKNTELLAEELQAYFDATQDNYDAAVTKVARQLGATLLELPATSTVQHVLDAVFADLYTKWGRTFSEPQRKVVTKYVEQAYSAFRRDKSIFNGVDVINGKKIPDATFNLLDIRAIEYYKKSDNLYLGKFITDADTKKKITAYIKQAYLEENTPIGQNKEGLIKFRKEFADVLQGEDWKISRILNTTVNHMRNGAAVSYMQEAEVVRFKIAGVVDRLQCPFCFAMQGRTFDVKIALDRFEKMSTTTPASIGEVRPFINKIFKNASELATLTDGDIQMRGIDLPAYHSHCRDVIIADI